MVVIRDKLASAPIALLGLLLVAALFLAVLRVGGIGSIAKPHAVAADAEATMPDIGERKALIALTHEPSTEVVSKGEAAVEGNEKLPFSEAKILAAAPFSVARASEAERQKAELCMTQAVYYEAGFEPLAGKRAVAQTVLNRLRHPAFPHSVCGVVYEGALRPVCQFSFTCDGALGRRPAPAAWAEARRVAHDALNGYVEKSVGLATHYHANYVLPRWAPELAKIAKIGAHIFYRWPGGWGMPRAFGQSYSGIETVPLFNAAVQAEPVIDYPAVAALPERRAQDDVGGRIDISKGWKPNIPAPSHTSSALTKVYAAQSVTSAEVIAP
ncbi:cell wall hydrolase [Rhizorhapis suberifaciens]|uniref:Spore germination cell wall hydrolase CwlJ-like protein n=1 Tax=Rhizorhapis suberifaciens TaxID=13656 RepID=A0A840HX09_9SPHN|nr:cell wall hydrolase [Rhizorhapis suberifaciens]MBB4642147.1 spore germination cell wall hydrolase CwlJ-like protein [Rhizorhapis suberifaciens]